MEDGTADQIEVDMVDVNRSYLWIWLSLVNDTVLFNILYIYKYLYIYIIITVNEHIYTICLWAFYLVAWTHMKDMFDRVTE